MIRDAADHRHARRALLKRSHGPQGTPPTHASQSVSAPNGRNRMVSLQIHAMQTRGNNSNMLLVAPPHSHPALEDDHDDDPDDKDDDFSR